MRSLNSAEQATTRNLGRRALLGALLAPAAFAGSRWTQFRGDAGASAAGADELPTTWSDDSNITWSIVPPGYGQSSPVVYRNKVFLTGVDGPNKETLLLTAFDLGSGESLWTHRGSPAQAIEESDMVSKAAPTPAVDPESVYAFFETGNLVALDHGGKVRWERKLTDEFGEFGGRHGIGSSLRLCHSGVLALAAHDDPSYLICVDTASGETVWKADRDKGISWTTPTIVEHDDREIALVSGGDRVDVYDTADGSLLWTLDGFSGAFVASPTPIAGGAIIASGEKGQTAAIRFGSKADSPPEITWRASEAASYFSSPVVHESRVYMVNKAGVAFCLDLETGKEHWHERLAGACWASSVAAGGAVYFFGVDGAVELFRAADLAEKIADNRLLEESRLYGVAVSEGSLLLRFGRRLVRVDRG